MKEEESHFSDNALNDMKLVERALKHNDQKAYEELMKRYRELIYFMLLGIMNKNKDDAEDLTMETFGKAFKNLHQYSTAFAFSTWLFKIATNTAIDFIRRNEERKNTLSLNKPFDNESGEEFSAFVKGVGLNPEENIIRKQNINRVRSIIKKLKPNYREIVELFYIEELSNEEIAKHIGLPIATVKTRLFRARSILLSIINKQGNF